MYTISQIKKGILNPDRATEEVNRLYHTRFGKYTQNPQGENFIDEDWDNLLILDAFRHDVFEEFNNEMGLPGTLKMKTSAGSTTPEFLAANVDQADLTDTVYVTASTMLYRQSILSNKLTVNFHAIEDVWGDSIDYGEWGVGPEPVTKQALDAIDEHPNKRLIVHYIQPHVPFLGPTADEIYNRIDSRDPWNELNQNKDLISDDLLWKAYYENAELILSHVQDVLSDFQGKTVVTSDHGQLIGDQVKPIPRKAYGHPPQCWVPELVNVPWLIYEGEERRQTYKEEPNSTYSPKRDRMDSQARDHLRDLGYLS